MGKSKYADYSTQNYLSDFVNISDEAFTHLVLENHFNRFVDMVKNNLKKVHWQVNTQMEEKVKKMVDQC